MEDLAREVVARLRDDDGPFAVSLLQEPNYTDDFVLITPVRTDGKISFNVRIADHRSGLLFTDAEAPALNFTTAAQAAQFASSIPRSDFVHDKRPAVARLVFVPTASPSEQRSVVRLSLRVDDEANAAYAQLIATLPMMRMAR